MYIKLATLYNDTTVDKYNNGIKDPHWLSCFQWSNYDLGMEGNSPFSFGDFDMGGSSRGCDTHQIYCKTGNFLV